MMPRPAPAMLLPTVAPSRGDRRPLCGSGTERLGEYYDWHLVEKLHELAFAAFAQVVVLLALIHHHHLRSIYHADCRSKCCRFKRFGRW